ncbi:hypothetical protein PR001_g29489 [Phytophthora rubi]|uniref:Ubiquitin-like protease family profile domain-containing protein n=1 Tax=Phytophthora rubi TaxID=129364 RepID=A0A6A3H177_9STRA|nr:hypothetical protein PR002_g29562 [Phytophthora rubi]KAE8963090.1 hypothetical protein PR001_g29489 [Phytophthora rubi]
MHMVLMKKFESDPDVVVFEAAALGVVVDGKIEADKQALRRAMSGLTKEIVLLPVNCNGNHWCAVMMNLKTGKVFVYDSSSSSYLLSVRAVAQTLILLLPEDVRPSARVQTYESGLGCQVDSYNCGVYVLLAFELFCGAEPLGYLSKKTLQWLRYRYLQLCLEA